MLCQTQQIPVSGRPFLCIQSMFTSITFGSKTSARISEIVIDPVYPELYSSSYGQWWIFVYNDYNVIAT